MKLADLALTPGATHTVAAKVVDPTTFVRDPAIQNGTALTQTLTWTVKDAANTPGAAETPTITGGTQNDRAVGRNDVDRRQPSHPADGSVPAVAWKLDGATVAAGANGSAFHLADQHLDGRHAHADRDRRGHDEDLDGRRDRRRDDVHDVRRRRRRSRPPAPPCPSTSSRARSR